jgi:hypothetical protein
MSEDRSKYIDVVCLYPTNEDELIPELDEDNEYEVIPELEEDNEDEVIPELEEDNGKLKANLLYGKIIERTTKKNQMIQELKEKFVEYAGWSMIGDGGPFWMNMTTGNIYVYYSETSGEPYNETDWWKEYDELPIHNRVYTFYPRPKLGKIR